MPRGERTGAREASGARAPLRDTNIRRLLDSSGCHRARRERAAVRVFRPLIDFIFLRHHEGRLQVIRLVDLGDCTIMAIVSTIVRPRLREEDLRLNAALLDEQSLDPASEALVELDTRLALCVELAGFPLHAPDLSPVVVAQWACVPPDVVNTSSVGRLRQREVLQSLF